MRISKEKNAYNAMIGRCYKPNHHKYRLYGDRGIRVCNRWLKSFDNFLEDMGACPAGKSLDRIENDKGYSKENCRWATIEEQNNNRRTVIKLTHNGETLCMLQWSKRLGIPSNTIAKRNARGWPVERILSLERFVFGKRYK